jgi:hypothetical protein
MIYLIILKIFILLVQNGQCIEETNFDTVSAKKSLVKSYSTGKIVFF